MRRRIITTLLVFCSVLATTEAIAVKSESHSSHFKQSGFFPSWSEEQDARQRRLEQELSATLEMLPGVESVKVHIAIQSGVAFPVNRSTRSGASVVILSHHPSLIRKDELKAIVAGASAELSDADVRVFVYDLKLSKTPACPDDAPHGSDGRVSMANNCWKPCGALLVILIMCGALFMIGIGVRRLLRQRRHGA